MIQYTLDKLREVEAKVIETLRIRSEVVASKVKFDRSKTDIIIFHIENQAHATLRIHYSVNGVGDIFNHAL